MLTQNEEKFDAGPLWSWKPNTINVTDFENCIIDDKSLTFLKITQEQHRVKQRFAIYGYIEKKDGQSIYHVRYQPSLPSYATKEEIKEAEQVFGEGNVVVAEAKQTGIVHDKTLALLIKQAEEKKDETLAQFLRNNYFEVGLSCMYDSEKFRFLNRGAMIGSTLDLNEFGRYAFFLANIPYDEKKQEFGPKELTFERHLGRSVPQKILDITIDTLTHTLRPPSDQVIPDDTKLGYYTEGITSDDCFSYYYQDLWEKEYRNNKEKMGQLLSQTIYKAAGLTNGEPGPYWTQINDVDIVLNALEIAKKNNIVLDLDEWVGKIESKGITALMFAAKKGSLTLVQSLIENGCSIYINDVDGHNAIWYAKDEEVLNYLTAVLNLNEAIRNNNVEEVTQLMHSRDVDLNITLPIHDNMTPLEKAIEYSKPESLQVVVNRLIELGENIDNPASSKKITPLFLAAQLGDLDKVNILLKAGADPKLVLEHKYYKDTTIPSQIHTLLHESAYPKLKKNKEVQDIKSRNQDTSPTDGESAAINLHDTITSDYFKEDEDKIIKFLDQFIQNDGNINQQNAEGNTAIHLAVQSNQAAFLQALIDRKADLNIKNLARMTPLDIAIKEDNTADETLLAKHGGKSSKALSQPSQQTSIQEPLPVQSKPSGIVSLGIFSYPEKSSEQKVNFIETFLKNYSWKNVDEEKKLEATFNDKSINYVPGVCYRQIEIINLAHKRVISRGMNDWNQTYKDLIAIGQQMTSMDPNIDKYLQCYQKGNLEDDLNKISKKQPTHRIKNN